MTYSFKDDDSLVGKMFFEGFCGNKKPWLIMLVGLPCSGKTTFRNKIAYVTGLKVMSLDDCVNAEAKKLGINYTDAFMKVDFSVIKQRFNDELAATIALGKDIIIDMTNTSVESRKEKLDFFDSTTYEKVAVVFESFFEDILKRNEERSSKEGKTIPLEILTNMKNRFVMPTQSEGFDIIFVKEK